MCVYMHIYYVAIQQLAVTADHRVKMKIKKTKSRQVLKPSRRTANIRASMKPILLVTLGTAPKDLERGLGGAGNQRTNRDHRN